MKNVKRRWNAKNPIKIPENFPTCISALKNQPQLSKEPSNLIEHKSIFIDSRKLSVEFKSQFIDWSLHRFWVEIINRIVHKGTNRLSISSRQQQSFFLFCHFVNCVSLAAFISWLQSYTSSITGIFIYKHQKLTCLSTSITFPSISFDSVHKHVNIQKKSPKMINDDHFSLVHEFLQISLMYSSFLVDNK